MTTRIEAIPLSAEAFAPYGAVLQGQADGAPPGQGDGALDLSGGQPRFYVMALDARPPRFDRITRHRAVTQCLAAVGGNSWWLAVAPPVGLDDPDAVPELARLLAFRVPGDVAVLLARGTWHAGPFFAGPAMSFFNLELAGTNDTDHHCVELGQQFEICAD